MRQKAQQGLFTHLNADNYICLDEYLVSRKMSHLLTCYKIPAVEVTTIIYDLNLMNINHASIYPDLHGAAMQANIHAAAYFGFGMIAEAMSSNSSTGFADE